MPLQSQQIVALACQAAKCPGYTVQAGQFLNQILRDLCQFYDFDVNKQTYNFSFINSQSSVGFGPGFGPGFVLQNASLIGFGPYLMPLNWLRAAKDEVYYTISSVPYTMIRVSNAEFETFVTLSGLTAFPSYFTIYVGNIDQGVASAMYVWVAPSGSFPVTAYYYALQPDILNPQTSTAIPWFPNQTYLRQKLVATLMAELTNDDRAAPTMALADANLDKYLKMKDDQEGFAKQVSLDRRLFGKRFSTLPNTKLVGF
jgi:hypothetical protein